MATVLGYGHLRRSRSEVIQEEEETDGEVYLRLSQSSGCGDKYYKVLKRYLEEGRSLELFQIWKEEHKKVYKDAEEENSRFLLFESRLKWIVERGHAHNYSLVLIDCSDRTQEELDKIFPTSNDRRHKRESIEDLLSMVRQYKLLHSRGNLRSLCLAINHRLRRPGSLGGTTGFGNYQSYFSIKNTFFSTPRPNITMPYAPKRTPPRPPKEFNSLPSIGNNIGIATILGSQWGSSENYLYTTGKNSLSPDIAMSYALKQSPPRPLHQCNSLPSYGSSMALLDK